MVCCKGCLVVMHFRQFRTHNIDFFDSYNFSTGCCDVYSEIQCISSVRQNINVALIICGNIKNKLLYIVHENNINSNRRLWKFNTMTRNFGHLWKGDKRSLSILVIYGQIMSFWEISCKNMKYFMQKYFMQKKMSHR